MMSRILLVEGEGAIAGPLVRALARAGHATTTVATGSRALALAGRVRFDVALVDATLPDGDGRALVDPLHRRGRTPVMILCDDRAQADRHAWSAGAEDYVVKPVRASEAISLMRAVLRRWDAAGGSSEILRVGPLELDTLTHCARMVGRELQLAPKEAALLARLMRDAGTAVPRERLLRDVWGKRRADGARTLDMHVALLRRKLADDPARPRLLHTIRGVGFRLSSATELA